MPKHLPDTQTDTTINDRAVSDRGEVPSVSTPDDRPRGRRRAVAVAAAIALVLVVSVGLAVALGRHGAPNPATSSTATSPSGFTVGSGNAHDYVLHRGDTVQGIGEVLELPGRPVRFCAPRAFLYSDNVHGGDPEFGYCPAGLDLHGVNLSDLADRKQQRGKVYGYARLTGVYHGDSLTVTRQVATKPAADDVYTDPPCSPPAGGWSTKYRNLGTIVDYKRSHPTQVVEIAYLLPSPHHRVPYVVTAGAPGPVRAALTPTYGSDLCVARSRYTERQLRNASTTMRSLFLHQGSPESLTDLTSASGMDLDARAQPDTPAEVAVVSRGLARVVDALPRGIVQLQVWLAPET